MSEKNWKPYISRLRQDPSDAEALDAIEAYLAASSEGKGRGKKAVGVLGTASRYVFKMFLGATLYRAVVTCWDAWSSFFYGNYTSSTLSPWPEAETRDLSAAVAARFLRIGMFGILIGLIPAIMLGFQTALMIVQVWQVNTQNEIIKEQNGLTREQFAIGYRAQFITQLYDYREKNVGNETVCESKSLPRVRAEAATSLLKLERVLDAEKQEQVEAPKEGEEGAEASTKKNMPSISGACLADTELVERDFSLSMLDEVSFYKASLDAVDFSSSSLRSAGFQESNISKSTFDNAYMKRTSFDKARIYESSMKGATLLDPNFDGATLVDIDFTDAVFFPTNEPKLRSRNKLDLSEAQEMKKLNFTRANLILARFTKRGLIDVNFKDAKLVQANFVDATLTKVSFENADLTGAKFSGATLDDVNFKGAEVSFAKSSDVKFNNVICPDGKNSDSQGKRCK
jgi:uncharacterized protein YjbI with pentapeptide repeats